MIYISFILMLIFSILSITRLSEKYKSKTVWIKITQCILYATTFYFSLMYLGDWSWLLLVVLHVLFTRFIIGTSALHSLSSAFMLIVVFTISELIASSLYGFVFGYTESLYEIELGPIGYGLFILVTISTYLYVHYISTIITKEKDLCLEGIRLLFISDLILYVGFLVIQYYLHFSQSLMAVETKSYFAISMFLINIMYMIIGIYANRVIVADNALEKYRHRASTDLLTGVYSREAGLSFLKKEMLRASINGDDLTIAYLDVNDLKITNDTYGHKEGDRMMKLVTEVIKDNLRDNDAVARLGGDEFMIIFKRCNIEQAEKVWGRISTRFGVINSSNKYVFKISVSAGFSQYDNTSHTNVLGFVQEADDKMYIKKKALKESRKASLVN